MSWWSAPNSQHAFILACVSFVSTTTSAIIGLTLYELSDSPLCLVYGLENFVDLISDMIVLWRFYCPYYLDVTPDREDVLMKREQRASVAISLVLTVLGIYIIITATYDFYRGQERLDDHDAQGIIIISILSLMVFGTLTIFKFHYSVALKSSSLQKDGICSLIGTILSFCLLVDALITETYPQGWWFDPAVSIGCGIASFLIGIQAILAARCRHQLPIFRLSWWFASQGDHVHHGGSHRNKSSSSSGGGGGDDGVSLKNNKNLEDHDDEFTEQGSFVGQDGSNTLELMASNQSSPPTAIV